MKRNTMRLNIMTKKFLSKNKNYRPMTEGEIKEMRNWLDEKGYECVEFYPVIPIDEKLCL